MGSINDNKNPSLKTDLDKEPTNVGDVNDEKEKTSCGEKTKNCMGLITAEPAVFLGVMMLMLSIVTNTSLTVRKFCLTHMNLTDEVCRNLSHNEDLEKEAQKLTTDFNTYKTVLETLPTVFLTLFLGSWSDTHGRKPLIFLTNIGTALSAAVMFVNAYYEEISPMYILTASIPFALSGGIMPQMLGAIAMISDITTPETRTVRISLLYSAMMCGAPIGSMLGGIIFANFGYLTVYSVVLAVSFLNLLYIGLWLKESVKKPDNISLCEGVTFGHFVDGLRTVFKKRENNQRLHISLFILAMMLNFFPMMGEMNIMYLYTRYKFKWDEAMYSYYSAATLVSGMIGLMVVLPIITMVFKVSDTIIALLGAIAKVCSEMVVAFTPGHLGWLLFAFTPLQMISGMYGAIMKSMLTKVVSKAEQGKVLSVQSAAEAAMPVFGGAIYNQVYRATVDTFAGASFLMSAVVCVIPAGIFWWILRDVRKLEKKANSVETVEADSTTKL